MLPSMTLGRRCYEPGELRRGRRVAHDGVALVVGARGAWRSRRHVGGAREAGEPGVGVLQVWSLVPPARDFFQLAHTLVSTHYL